MRDQEWLDRLLATTWRRYFSDLPQGELKIQFGRNARTRLGSIKLDRREPQLSVITLNGLFRDPAVPELVPLATLVHELIHYAHGFNSPLEQQHRYPHSGGVIRKEFAERGLEWLYLQQKAWLKQHWPQLVRDNFRASGRTKRVKVPLPFWYIG